MVDSYLMRAVHAVLARQMDSPLAPPAITGPMTEQSAPSLLDDLDSRQDAVLLQLDELNKRVEQLLKQHTIGLRVVDEQEGEQDPTPAAA